MRLRMGFGLDEKEEAGIFSQADGGIVEYICLLHLLVVNGEDILRGNFLDEPCAVVPEKPGVRS